MSAVFIKHSGSLFIGQDLKMGNSLKHFNSPDKTQRKLFPPRDRVV